MKAITGRLSIQNFNITSSYYFVYIPQHSIVYPSWNTIDPGQRIAAYRT